MVRANFLPKVCFLSCCSSHFLNASSFWGLLTARATAAPWGEWLREASDRSTVHALMVCFFLVFLLSVRLGGERSVSAALLAPFCRCDFDLLLLLLPSVLGRRR